jgi:hypothetical protein
MVKMKMKNLPKHSRLSWGLVIPIPIIFFALAIYTIPTLLEIIQPNPLNVIVKDDPDLRKSIIQFSIGAVYTYGLIIGGWFLGLITQELIWRTRYAVRSVQEKRRRNTP